MQVQCEIKSSAAGGTSCVPSLGACEELGSIREYYVLSATASLEVSL
jgi:hypothetical protein